MAEAPTQVIRNKNGTWTFIHYVQLPDGSQVKAIEVAERAMAAWQDILRNHDLYYYVDPGALPNTKR